MSDVYYIFQEAMKIKDEKEAVSFIFDNLSEFSTDSLLKMWDDFLEHEKSSKSKKIKKMQTGGGMMNSLPTNSVYRGKVIDLY